MDFSSRYLETGHPTIQCTACGKYTHWRKDCPYDNFCTTCNDHSHTTHMCRIPKSSNPSPVICIYCDNTDHKSSNCPNKPWDNREEPQSTPESLRNQQDQQANTEISGSATGNAPSSGMENQGNSTQRSASHGTNTRILGNPSSNLSSNSSK